MTQIGSPGNLVKFLVYSSFHTLPSAIDADYAGGNENRSVTDFPGCVPAPGGGLCSPGVRRIGNPSLGRFGLAPPRDPSRRVRPGSRSSASALTAPVIIGLSPGQTHEAGENPSSAPHRSLPRKENPRSCAPNCSGEGGRQQHNMSFKTFYY